MFMICCAGLVTVDVGGVVDEELHCDGELWKVSGWNTAKKSGHIINIRFTNINGQIRNDHTQLKYTGSRLLRAAFFAPKSF